MPDYLSTGALSEQDVAGPQGDGPRKSQRKERTYQFAVKMVEGSSHALREEQAFLLTLFAGKE